MVDPKDEVPFDDTDDLDKEDQLSQRDVHSTGVEPDPEELEEGKEADTDLLQQSFDASEAAYTLRVDDEPKKDNSKKK